MRLRRLRIARLPGLEGRPLEVDGLDADVVVIVGANGAGKSSLVRALRALLWPAERPGAIDAVAELVDGDAAYTVERVVDAVTWRRDGDLVPAPQLAPHAVVDGLVFGVEDLVRADSAAGRDAAAAVRRALAGGVSVEAARANLRPSARAGSVEAEALRRATTELALAQRDQRELTAEARQLAGLDAEIADATTAHADAAHLRDALLLREARLDAAAAAAARAALPATLARVPPDAADRLAALRAEVEQRALRAASARRALGEADAALAVHGATELPDEAELAGLAALVDALAATEGERAQASQTHAAAHARRSAAEADLDAVAPGIVPGPDDVAAAHAQALDAERLARRAQVIEEATALHADERAPDRGEHAAVVSLGDALDDWLATPEPAPRRVAIAVVGGVLVLAGVALAVSLTPWALAVAALGALLLGLFLAPGRSSLGARHTVAEEELRRAASALRVVLPTRLEPIDGRRLRDDVARRRAALDLAAERERAAADDRRRLEVRSAQLGRDRASLVARRDALHARLGFRPRVAEAGVALLVERVAAIGAARVDEAGAVAALAALDARFRALQERIARACGTAPPDAAAARRSCERLAGALAARRAAEAEVVTRRAALADADADLAAATERLSRFTAPLALSTDDPESSLRELVGARPRWESLRAREAAADEQAARLARSLGAAATLAELDAAELELRLGDAERLAARLGELHDRRATLGQAIAAAAGGSAVGDAVVARDAARDALGAVRDEVAAAAAAIFLLDAAEEEYERAALPETQREAAALLARFTQGAWALELPRTGVGSEPVLAARDAASGVVRPLGELSTGTRAQVLLAARLAWATAAEPPGSLRAPLVLDEALANADPVRFAAIADALLGLAAAQGRQVVFLTSEHDDAARIAARGGEAVRVIDLDAAVPAALPVVRELAPVAVPAREEGEALDAWLARIGAPRLDPVLGGAALPVHYLLCDVDRLVTRLAGARIGTAGALAVLLDQGGLADLPTTTVELLRARIAVARAWCDAACVGREPRLGRADVAALPALRSSVFRDRIIGLVEELDAVDGMATGSALVAALAGGRHDIARPPRMRTTTVELIRQELTDAGLIAVETRLTGDEVRAHALAAAGPLGIRGAATLVDTWERHAWSGAGQHERGATAGADAAAAVG